MKERKKDTERNIYLYVEWGDKVIFDPRETDLLRLNRHHYYSIEKIRRDLGWTPKVSLLEGIKRTAEGVRAAGNI